MKKTVMVEDVNGNCFEMESKETRVLTDAEVKERLKNTPKIDVNALLSHGYRKLEDVCNDIENGII